ncbi:MAG: S41 family peptidase [Acidobacteriota bacterium]|nr:S41 family peptidase [Acidobacteriota bacterium]
MNSSFKWTVIGSSTCVVVLLLLGARSGRAVATDDVYGHLKVYTEVLERIKLEYVEEPDMKSVTLGAINGLLESVDPFASYLSPDQYRQYEKMHDAGRAGVGLILAKRYGYVAVVDVIPGSPADKANVSSGDLIETINGVATRDMPLAYAEEILQGAPDSTIEISILRLKNPDPQKITLTRTVVSVPQVTAKLLPNDVGYLHVTSLLGNRESEVKTKVQDLKKQGAKYMVLDLRHCSTGDDANGIGLANLFLDKGGITSLQGQKTEKKDFEAKPDDQIWKGPLVLITDRATAGGSEIAAAALLDDKRAQIVGERTYGDASLRKTIEMEDGGAVILSVAKYYSPSGKAIQDSGVTPSVQLAENDNTPDVDQDGKPIPGTAKKNSEDNLLKQSIDLVTGKTTIAQLTSGEAGNDRPYVNQPPPIITKAPVTPDTRTK